MSPKLKSLLIVDDDPEVLAGLAAVLGHSGWSLETASSGREALRQFDSFSPDVVLLDVMLPDMSGLDVLDAIKGASETTAVVVMSGVGTIDTAVRAMKMGAETFVPKPCDVDGLEAILEQAAAIADTRHQLEAMRRANAPKQLEFIGISEHARRVEHLIGRVAAAPTPVLLTGESGTGKGIAARLIHQRSDRHQAAFVDLNCAGLSHELLESELFGHEKGAFTDAKTTKQGLLEVAGHGTVFLDEIGEMELTIQARLLKALEEKRFRRLGGVREIKADFRLIAATNRDLEAEASAGRFRRDLLYRLNVVTIEMPPLRERSDDIPMLVQLLLAELTQEFGRREEVHVSDRAMARMLRHPWPGNVRELRNVLERALLVRKGSEIRVEDLLLEKEGTLSTDAGVMPKTEWEIRPLDDVVRDYVHAAVEATEGNIRSAARRLDISPSTIYAKLKDAGKGTRD
ncbi:MAG: sigma-54-dependent transcriptional regulator [Thermoanaerobaculia bacterium]